MKNFTKKSIYLLIFYFLISTSIYAQVNPTVSISVDASIVVKNGIVNPCGAVSCWLLDSDIERPRNRSMETALGDIKAGAIRFPYGHLANNYLWTKDPYNIPNNLEPAVAVSNWAPGKWNWAVDGSGYFIKDQDFDEFVSLCKNINAEPVIVVNIMSYIYSDTDDITIDKLINYAVEWVRYSNITKGYGVKYWQIGNEQDHHDTEYPLAQYEKDYVRMAAAMRAIDPSIKIGPGLLGNNWTDNMLANDINQIDFMTSHQYTFTKGSLTEGYNAWKGYGNDLISNNIGCNNLIKSSAKPNMEILITETSTYGGNYPDPNVFNLYKGLILFEMQLNQIAVSNVKNTFFWGTHSPWQGENGETPGSVLFTNNLANSNNKQADILKAINTNIQPKLISKKTQDNVVSYSTLSESDDTMVVFLINKNTDARTINFQPQNTGTIKTYEKWVYSGQNEFDATADIVLESSGNVNNTTFQFSIAPLSVTIMRLSLEKNVIPPSPTFIETFDNISGSITGTGSPQQILGTSGVTYTRGPSTVTTTLINGTPSMLIRTDVSVAGYINFPLAKGVNSLKFTYKRPYAYRDGEPVSIYVTLAGKSYTFTTSVAQTEFLAEFNNVNFSQATFLRIDHDGSNVGFAIDNIEWTDYSSGLGVEDYKSGFTIYPNPVKDYLNVESNLESTMTEFKIYDLSGRLIKEGDLQNNQIFMGFLQPGFYLVNLSTDISNTVKKIKVER